MNKPQYLAELGQLLIFMTRADREKTLARYGALFDAAGPEGLDALLAHLGSTTRQAIRLSRIYDAGGYEDGYLDDLETDGVPEPSPEQEPAAAPEPEQEPAGHAPTAIPEQLAALIEEDLPDFELPDLPDFAPDEPPEEPSDAAGEETPPEAEPRVDEEAPEQEPAAGPEQAPAAETESVPPETNPDAGGETQPGGGDEDDGYEELWGKRPVSPAESGEEEDDAPEEPDEEQEPAPRPAPAVRWTVERSIPLWAGVPLFILSVLCLALPIAVLCLALTPVLLVPGLAVLLGACLAGIGGLWCISIIADAAVLFGAALILLALGLIVLWWGLWLDVAMISGYIRALRGLAHLTLGRKVMVHA